MSTRTKPLTPEQRSRILAAVYRELFVSCPATQGEARSAEGAKVMENRLEELVGIVRRSTAEAVEPYLNQFLDDICSKCPHETVSGYCPQRVAGPCVLYRFAGPIVAATARALRAMGDEEYLARWEQ